MEESSAPGTGALIAVGAPAAAARCVVVGGGARPSLAVAVIVALGVVPVVSHALGEAPAAAWQLRRRRAFALLVAGAALGVAAAFVPVPAALRPTAFHLPPLGVHGLVTRVTQWALARRGVQAPCDWRSDPRAAVLSRFTAVSWMGNSQPAGGRAIAGFAIKSPRVG